MYFMIKLKAPLSDEDARWYELHGVVVKRNALVFNTPCRAFDFATRRCTIYEKRPKCCRDAAVGGPICLSSRLHMKGLGVKIGD